MRPGKPPKASPAARGLAAAVSCVAIWGAAGVHAQTPPPAPVAAAAGLPLQPARHIAFDTDEGAWLSLTVSPDGHTIVFDLLGDLYALDGQGGTARPLTRGMAFDSQPAFSPDGAKIAFVSDRSGAENLWVANADGSDARQVTRNDSVHEYVSPAWSADGRSLFASLYRSDLNAIELWRYPVEDGGPGQELTGGKFSALGAAPSRDGRFVYYAAHVGKVFEDDVTLPLWSIDRLDLSTGQEETIVTNQGSAMRPVLSPDGRALVYAVRAQGQTALRIRTLDGGADRALVQPIQRDVQEALPTRDLVPGYAFTPDGQALLANIGGRIQRIEVATGATSTTPFNAHVALDLGPLLRQALKAETGPVRARLIQGPVQSPDGGRIAFSALGRIYVMDLKGGAPRPVTGAAERAFQPAWSPDGRTLAYVTWASPQGGQLWVAPADGRGPARRMDAVDAYYTDPAFTPDGRSLMALRSSAYERMHTLQEPLWTGRAFGPLRQADLIAVPLQGGAAKVVATGQMSGTPQFTRDPARVFIVSDQGLDSIGLDGADRQTVLSATGPGFYFQSTDVPADDIMISPDGRWALIQIAQQLQLVGVPAPGDAATPIDLNRPRTPHRKLTSVGADFFGWADGGRTITWAVGSTFYRRPLSGVVLDPPDTPVDQGDRPMPGKGSVEAFRASVEVPRDRGPAPVVLRGATAVTMKGDEVIADADIVVRDGRIAAIGPRGQVSLPAGAAIEDLGGRFVTPGFIDVHDHFGEIRRGVLDFDDWGFKATLAYGVTTALDPSTLSIDMLAYQDLIEAGQVVAPRLYSTATAVFSYNRFTSLQQVEDVVSRYVEHYRTRNLKEYRTGPRRVRQWVAMAARDQGSMPTTEGALDMKLDLTQILDGFSGNEHTLAAVPLYRDVVELLARSGTSYDVTMEISHGGPPAGEGFIAATRPYDDPKVAAFYPRFVRDKLFTRVHWVDPREEIYPQVAASAGAVQRAGGVVGIGSHGNYPGIGYHWELFAMASGGLTPREVLRAATVGSAQTIGRAGELGSLEPGKFADLLVFARDPLADIKNVGSLQQVMKNGRLYDAADLKVISPVAPRRADVSVRVGRASHEREKPTR
ncbi:amidohydrolase family protein [Phenylobacterium hankyongense]|nr:amidohydrolase family protein [Phenylobacterium hankyongense]